jgi:hypothetical protein
MSLWQRSLSFSSTCSKSASRQYRNFSNGPPRRIPRLGVRVVLGASVGATTAFAFSRLGTTDVYADTSDDTDVEDNSIRNSPLTSLLRSYVVFSVCSVPAFVDWSPQIISIMTSIPGLKQLTEALVRRSFFAQVRTDLLCHHGRGLITLTSVCRRGYRRRLYTGHSSPAEPIQRIATRIQCRS